MISRGFTLLWSAETVSEFGDRVTELALPLIAVVALDATATQAGILTAAVWAPNLLGVLVGSWTDRRSFRKPILVAASLVRAAVLATLPIAHFLGLVTFAQLCVVALLTGTAQVFSMTAAQAFFVSLVPSSRYVEANSRLSVSRSASFVGGPALGGYLIQVLTAPVAVVFDALSFVIAAILMGRIRSAPVEVSASSPFLSDVRDGLRYVLTHRYLRASLSCVTTVNFFTFAAQALAVLFMSRTLGLSSGLIGLAFGTGAVGGLLGALAAPRLSSLFGAGRVIVAGSVLFPLPIAAMAFIHGPHGIVILLVALGEFFSNAGVMLFDINLNAVQTAVTADAMRSRSAGVFSSINYGVRPLGALAGGLLGSAIGVRPTLVVAGVGGALCCLWLLRSPIRSVTTVDALSPHPVAVAPDAA